MRHWPGKQFDPGGRQPVNSERRGHFEGPVTVDLLADLQAGLLDDDAAAELRRRARTDPGVADQLAALDRVRRAVADLGGDAASAPEVPADVTARIGATLRSQPPMTDQVGDRGSTGGAHDRST